MESHQPPAQFEPRQWERRTTSLSQFAREIDEGLYNLNPEHQRDVVHDAEWQRNIILSLLNFNALPCVYFHAKPNQDGTRTFESLDGKQRCSAINNFMTNVIAVNFDDVSNFGDHRYGKSVTFGDLNSRHKHILANEVLFDIKIARDALPAEGVKTFFQMYQESRKTTLGEHLNSSINSPMRATINNLLQNGDIFSPTFKNKRHSHLEMLARMAYVEHASRTPAIDRFDPTPAVIKQWWDESAGELPDNFIRWVRATIKIIQGGEIKQKNSASVTTPILYFLLTDCRIGVDGQCDVEAGERLQAALKSGLIIFDDVNGQHDASRNRYLHLRRQMAQIAAES
jgi:hypothetical protein